MRRYRCIPVFVLLLLLQVACTAPATYRQPAPFKQGDVVDDGKAIVILAADFREKTGLRDNIPHFGQIRFRRLDDGYAARAAGDYDFGIEYALDADWASVFGRPDANRMPRTFQLAPGAYVIERINIGSGAGPTAPGYDPASKRVRYGGFAVRAGEVVNLGRLVVHMHWYRGVFTTAVEDNTGEVRQRLTEGPPSVAAALRTRLLEAAPQFPFVVGGAR